MSLSMHDLLPPRTPSPLATRQDLADRMSLSLADAGSAILLTSATGVLAFFTGTFVDVPATSTFCLTTCLGFVWNFVLNMIMYPALLCLDQKRMDAGLWSLIPCISCFNPKTLELRQQRNPSIYRRDSQRGGRGTQYSRNGSQCDLCMYKGVAGLMASFLSTPIGKFLSTVGLLTACIMSSRNISKLAVQTRLERVLPDDSYMLDYMALLKDKFNIGGGEQRRTVALTTVLTTDCDYAVREMINDCCYQDYETKASHKAGWHGPSNATFFSWMEKQPETYRYDPANPLGGSGAVSRPNIYGRMGGRPGGVYTRTWLDRYIEYLKGLGHTSVIELR